MGGRITPFLFTLSREMKALLLLFSVPLLAIAQVEESPPQAVPVPEAEVETPVEPPLPPPPKRELLINTDFTPLVRPEKLGVFRARAAELNRRHESMAEERERVQAAAAKKMKDFNEQAVKAGGQGATDSTPWISRNFQQRDGEFRKDVAAFENDVNAEIKLRRLLDAQAARHKAAVDAAIAKSDESPINAPHPSAEPRPVEKAKPSSVPGFPAGVEPAKKKSALPPGMTRGK